MYSQTNFAQNVKPMVFDMAALFTTLFCFNQAKYSATSVAHTEKIPMFSVLANTRSSHQRCSAKNLLLKISQNSQEKTCARVSFLIKRKHFMNTFFYRAPLVAASEILSFHLLRFDEQWRNLKVNPRQLLELLNQ